MDPSSPQSARLRSGSNRLSNMLSWRKPSTSTSSGGTAAASLAATTPDPVPCRRPSAIRELSSSSSSSFHAFSSASSSTPPCGQEASVPTCHSMPPETCIILKYLVDFLLKHKLHKNDLFLVDGKPKEKTKLMQCIQQGDLPERLNQYSSKSVSFVVLHLATHAYASLLPSSCYSQLVAMMGNNNHPSENVDGCVACIAAVMNQAMSPEQRALLESLLLLLYKLSLKQTARMNADVLGEVVGAELVRPAAGDGNALSSTRHSVGRFLVEYAPKILHECRANHPLGHTIPTEKASGDQARDTEEEDSQARASVEVPLVPLTSTTAIILRRTRSNREEHDNRKPLTRQVAARVSTVLTVIMASREDKHGLFVEETGVDNSVMSLLVGDAHDEIALVGVHALSLANSLREFLLRHVEPLLGQIDRSIRNDRSDHTDSIVRILQRTIQQLPVPKQDVLLLLLAAVRLAIDAGTDARALCQCLSSCFCIEEDEEQTAAEEVSWTQRCLEVLFSRTSMAAILHSVIQMRQRRAALKSKFRVVLLAVQWVVRCRRVSNQRQQQKQQRQPQRLSAATAASCRGDEDDSRLPMWTEAMATTLCDIVASLLEETRANPTQLTRLFLDPGDDLETAIILDKLLRGHYHSKKMDLSFFSPYSIATAVRKILTTAVAVPMKLEPQTRLLHLLQSQLDLMLEYEAYHSVRCELEEVFALMLPTEKAVAEPVALWKKQEAVEPPQLELRVAQPLNAIEQESPQDGEEQTSTSQSSDNQRAKSDAKVEYLSPAVVAMLLSRLDDILLVMTRCNEWLSCQKHDSRRREDDGQRLLDLLQFLQIPLACIKPERAVATLERVQQRHQDRNLLAASGSVLPSSSTWQIIETLVLETLTTLRHPVLAPMYPTEDEQLYVVLDVWGLGDRTVGLLQPGLEKS